MGCNGGDLLQGVATHKKPIAGKTSTWRIRCYDSAGQPADPLTLVIRFQLSGDSEPINTYTYGSNGEITKLAIGDYKFVLPVDLSAKTHKIEVETTGNAASVQGFFKPEKAIIQ